MRHALHDFTGQEIYQSYSISGYFGSRSGDKKIVMWFTLKV